MDLFAGNSPFHQPILGPIHSTNDHRYVLPLGQSETPRNKRPVDVWMRIFPREDRYGPRDRKREIRRMRYWIDPYTRKILDNIPPVEICRTTIDPWARVPELGKPITPLEPAATLEHPSPFFFPTMTSTASLENPRVRNVCQKRPGPLQPSGARCSKRKDQKRIHPNSILDAVSRDQRRGSGELLVNAVVGGPPCSMENPLPDFLPAPVSPWLGPEPPGFWDNKPSIVGGEGPLAQHGVPGTPLDGDLPKPSGEAMSSFYGKLLGR
ncbi:hypothetical protein F5Y12DRAFT_739521 [Xylaria sp. FL1777]|nr:hypothetical protein F5Y12DRAFT_739521 [Xylaria sp. FL1777]